LTDQISIEPEPACEAEELHISKNLFVELLAWVSRCYGLPKSNRGFWKARWPPTSIEQPGQQAPPAPPLAGSAVLGESVEEAGEAMGSASWAPFAGWWGVRWPRRGAVITQEIANRRRKLPGIRESWRLQIFA